MNGYDVFAAGMGAVGVLGVIGCFKKAKEAWGSKPGDKIDLSPSPEMQKLRDSFDADLAYLQKAARKRPRSKLPEAKL